MWDFNSFIKAVVFSAIVVLGAIAATDAFSKTTTELFADTQRLSGYGCPTKRVDLCAAPGVVIAELPEHILGVFNVEQASYVSINSSEDIGTKEWQSIVVHEYMHYLQWLAGKVGPHVSCDQNVDAEIEARKVGNAWLVENGEEPNQDNLKLIISMRMQCRVSDR